MDYQRAVDIYRRALVDIATALDTHQEARSEFDVPFLLRIMQDGFLQTVTEGDKHRLLFDRKKGEHFLLWYGVIHQRKMNWNCIGWIFPFYTDEEMERAYEMITRAKLDQQSWAKFRHFLLSCRLHLRLQETPIEVPTNIVKVRVTGDECTSAMRILEKSPPNLRYVTKTMMDQLPPSNYLLKRIQMKIVVGEKIEPYVLMPR